MKKPKEIVDCWIGKDILPKRYRRKLIEAIQEYGQQNYEKGINDYQEWKKDMEDETRTDQSSKPGE